MTEMSQNFLRECMLTERIVFQGEEAISLPRKILKIKRKVVRGGMGTE
jgi:hypothetical protein